MNYRICFINSKITNFYFKTKREALAFQSTRAEDTILERKITKGVWTPCK